MYGWFCEATSLRSIIIIIPFTDLPMVYVSRRGGEGGVDRICTSTYSKLDGFPMKMQEDQKKALTPNVCRRVAYPFTYLDTGSHTLCRKSIRAGHGAAIDLRDFASRRAVLQSRLNLCPQAFITDEAPNPRSYPASLGRG